MKIFIYICCIVGIINVTKAITKFIYYLIENIINRKNQRKYTQTSIKLDIELTEKIKKLSKEEDREFNNQIVFMLKKYIEMLENNKK